MKALQFVLALVASMFLSPFAMSQMCVNPIDGPRLIYDDGVEPGWETWSWGSPTIAPSTIAGKSGTTALRVTLPNSTGGGIQIQATGFGTEQLRTNGATALTFMLRKEMLGAVSVGIASGANSVATLVTADQPYVVPTNYNVNPAYNDWVIFSIPLTALQASNISLGGVVFATTVPGTFYLDKIELTEGFLRFPLDCSNASCSGVGVVDYRTKGAYTINSVTSVHDHSMKVNTSNGFYPYGDSASTLDGDVVAWTGEIGRGTPATPWCYPKVGGGSFSLKGTYIGTTSDGCTPAGGMNYDDHPGYDYKAEIGTPVKAVASGIVVSINNGNAVGVERCYIGNLGDTCDKWGAVGIDHGNGYVTQYLHMQISSITLSPGNPVTAGQIIGTSGQTSPPSRPVGPHLHFEVLKKVPGLTSGTYVYKMVDPYGFYADGQDDPLTLITGVRSSLLWK